MNTITKLSILWCIGCILIGAIIWGLIFVYDLLRGLIHVVLA